MKKSITKSLISYIDSIFVVNGEMIENNGEDSYMFSVNDNLGIIGVFDGCGGIGSRKYPEYSGKSGAYISSRIVSGTILKWFEEFCESGRCLSGNTIREICSELKSNVTDELKEYSQCTHSNTIKGSLTKSFPTTASIVLFSKDKAGLYLSYIWAGDSRGYILTPDGLMQVTKDDIENEGDALENISNDGKLTNVVSAEGDFELQSRIFKSDNAGILITATDGCFGYFSTPMEFEYMLIDTLLKSDNIEQWRTKVDDCIRKYTADDYTMALIVFGYKNIKKVKKAFLERYKHLFQKYIKCLNGIDEKEKNHLWNEYKDNYYRGV